MVTLIQTPLSEYVEFRLEEWATWFQRYVKGGLGYPKKSTIALWREGWSILTKAYGSRALPSHTSAEEIENLVTEMATEHAEWALALRCHYFSQERSLRQQAKLLKLSHSNLGKHLTGAKGWLEGRLSAQVRLSTK